MRTGKQWGVFMIREQAENAFRPVRRWLYVDQRAGAGIFPIPPEDFPRTLEVWEASVRATHHFVREADIQFFKPLVRDALQKMEHLACARDENGQVAGFVAVAEKKVEMLFIVSLYNSPQ